MRSGKKGIQPRFGPSNRILDLARHKSSQAVWATAPCEKLNWGTQELIRPISSSALTAVPSPRILELSRHRRGLLSAGGDLRRKEEDEGEAFYRESQHSSSGGSRFERIVRLSAPKTRKSQEVGLPAPRCPRGRPAVVSVRLEQLSKPKQTHPDFQSNRQALGSVPSATAKAPISHRLLRLSLPRLRESNAHRPLRPPEDAIWTVSRAAASARASTRVETLATAKRLCQGYLPPQEPEWRPRPAGLLPR